LNLAIDIGNSFVKLAAIDKGKVIKKAKAEKFTQRFYKKFIGRKEVEGIVLSSTRNSDERMLNFLKKQALFVNLDHKTKIPIKNAYKTPKTLGKDRLAAAIGAFKLYPKTNCLIIDVGTCMTYDFLDRKGIYMGGNIAPGIELRYRAMDEFTARLPLVKRSYTGQLFGLSTKSALQNGGLMGVIFEIEGFIGRLKQIYKNKINIILTGGDAEYLAEHIKTKIFVHPDLVLIGLNTILEHNQYD
jgi:type III pantothenate kinase